ncbi:choline dehydrogenase mitochondrial [Clonorchis sinensis]|uniref:Choline dehydrogenase mitochondrial n=1 Tax=Clonorchis sinensis TaxID=79923 RepID=G7YDS1_CLOSI|nr:choline dehydrogenase mitochondrial [Clonorchis sinensis]
MLPAIQSIKQLLLPTGRMVGGTAMLNAMLFSLGHPEDETFQLFSQWNPRFFSELYQEPGRAGCHFTPSSNYRHYLNEKFHVALSEVFKSLGLPARDSPDGWVREGMQTPLVFVQDYRRWSPYTNCLEPLLQHKDAQVTILPETLVEKVLFDPYKPGFVKGVLVAHKSAKFPIWLSNAREVNPIHPIPEVILSAGTFESPAILLRSGIGIEFAQFFQPSTITSLPVGSNFHDHPMIVLVCTFQRPVAISTKVLTPLEMLRYFWSGKSAVSQAGAITSIAYLRTSLQRIKHSSKPDIQFTFIAAAVFEQEIFQKSLTYRSLTLFNNCDEMNFSALMPKECYSTFLSTFMRFMSITYSRA